MNKSTGTLAIMTPNPDATAETFIRQHIRLIAPGKTVVLYTKGDGNAVQNMPRLKIEPSGGNFLLNKIRNVFRLLVYGYSGSFTGNERRQVIQFFEENGVVCVLAEFGQTACAIKNACKASGIPLYAFFHGQDASSGARTYKQRYSYWRMGHYATKIFVPTHFLASKVAKISIPVEKIDVAPYGLEVEGFHPSQFYDPYLVVAVGRMVAKKAPHLTVLAFALVHQKIPEARLEMIGDGPLLEKARSTANELGIKQSVIFHGARDHAFVKQKVAQAAIFVQHSLTALNGDTESLGVSLLEAMACEVPVVTTRHNGFMETVDDGVTGFLVEEKAVETMARRMIQLLKDHELRAKMGKAGRQRVLRYYESRQQAELLRKLMDL